MEKLIKQFKELSKDDQNKFIDFCDSQKRFKTIIDIHDVVKKEIEERPEKIKETLKDYLILDILDIINIYCKPIIYRKDDSYRDGGDFHYIIDLVNSEIYIELTTVHFSGCSTYSPTLDFSELEYFPNWTGDYFKRLNYLTKYEGLKIYEEDSSIEAPPFGNKLIIEEISYVYNFL